MAIKPPSSRRFLDGFQSDAMWMIASLLVAGGLILGFGLLAEEVTEGDTSGFDQAVLIAFRSAGDATNPIGPPWLEEMGRDVTSLGSFVFLGFVSVAAVGYLLITGKRRYAVLVAAAVAGGEAISTILKLVFDRQRPDIVHSARVFTASFPSGHAMLSAVTFLTLGALLAKANPNPGVKAYFVSLAVFLTVMVGLSRVYLGVHYPTDVLAGWCVGSAWAILCWSAIQRIEQSRGG
ncbi:phosphatase PAP2 family protein [Mesorhizobium sp. BR-1-1-8]|uniref:phosphatase PAP2 family protein n=1 Tax=unclassified Mesorhizobium TaxID=325217 RepID=UPI0011281CB0|nr:phosphatase PAP2 family protein [Mesorhizobium sp. BR-1-1-8]TPL26891.1 phosphatase PAP2 family protein [Mesorhizobium sp. B2-4-8]TPL59263.1 phosphatase PAP2 family protein [Mesorhizobium sp. B2-4-1]